MGLFSRTRRFFHPLNHLFIAVLEKKRSLVVKTFRACSNLSRAGAGKRTGRLRTLPYNNTRDLPGLNLNSVASFLFLHGNHQSLPASTGISPSQEPLTPPSTYCGYMTMTFQLHELFKARNCECSVPNVVDGSSRGPV